MTDISDHLPTVFTIYLEIANQKNCSKKTIFKRYHSDENVNKLKQRLSNVKWQDILKNNNVNDDYDELTETFKSLYDECIPPKECKVNRRKVTLSSWITKGLLKSINKKNKLSYETYHIRSSKSQLYIHSFNLIPYLLLSLHG